MRTTHIPRKENFPIKDVLCTFYRYLGDSTAMHVCDSKVLRIIYFKLFVDGRVFARTK